MQIEWTPPPPRAGWAGQWDRFVGPGATSAEEWLQLVGGGVLAALTIALTALAAPAPWSGWQWLVVGVLAFDLCGGLITNATATAKRWYHRVGHTRRQHFVFVLVHGVHIALLLAAFPGAQIGWGVAFYALLLIATGTVVWTPLYLQRPLAMALFAGLLVLNGSVMIAPGFDWFMPLLFLKLLIGHVLKEAPFAP